MYSTRESKKERIANFLGLNKKFHKLGVDFIDEGIYDVVSPVEAKLIGFGEIKENGIISTSEDEICLEKVIGKKARLFSNGFYLKFYLHPKNKHYWVVPYDGKFISTKINDNKAKIPIIIGEYFKRFNYLFEKAIEKNATIGSVLETKYFPIFMLAIGSYNVNAIHMNYKEDKNYKKGDVCGYFSIGSGMLLGFPDYGLELLIKSGDKVKIGMPIVRI